MTCRCHFIRDMVVCIQSQRRTKLFFRDFGLHYVIEEKRSLLISYNLHEFNLPSSMTTRLSTTQQYHTIAHQRTATIMRTYSISKSKAFCSGKLLHHSFRRCQLLSDFSHQERLELVSFHNYLGRGCIALGSILLITILMVTPRISWEAMGDRSVAIFAGFWGLVLGSSLVLIFVESSRQFKCASRIRDIDEELLETWTISTEEVGDDKSVGFDSIEGGFDSNKNQSDECDSIVEQVLENVMLVKTGQK